MRAIYYSPDMRRFVNADIIAGEISDSTSLNRYSYVNGNHVSFVDPFGLSSRESYDYGPYEEIMLKTLDLARKEFASYVKDRKNKDSLLAGYENVYNELTYAIKNGVVPKEFIDEIKVQFVIVPDYNMSGNELLMEIAGLIPVLNVVALFVQYDSMEKKKIFLSLMQLQL